MNKASSVRRVVMTSSLAAVLHPKGSGEGFTEADWNSDLEYSLQVRVQHFASP